MINGEGKRNKPMFGFQDDSGPFGPEGVSTEKFKKSSFARNAKTIEDGVSVLKLRLGQLPQYGNHAGIYLVRALAEGANGIFHGALHQATRRSSR